LMLRYKADQPLPPNTISRFIVRHNEEIQKEGSTFQVWRFGVVLKDGSGSIALVREFTDEREITVTVKGNDKTAYLDKLRDTLNQIFKSFKSKKPELQYRIERFGEIPNVGSFGQAPNIARFGNIPELLERDNPLWLSDSKIYNHYFDGFPYYDDVTGRHLSMERVVQIYNINAESLNLGGQGNIIERSIRNTFYNCNIALQGNLNDLAGSLRRKGEAEEAEALEDAAKALSEAEQCKSPEEVKKKGIINKLKRIIDDLSNEDSKLSKTIKGIKHGISIAQDIAKGYNDIAQWVGLPQVPKPFLGKD